MREPGCPARGWASWPSEPSLPFRLKPCSFERNEGPFLFKILARLITKDMWVSKKYLYESHILQ